MTALYLSRIQLADFRSFAKLDIALAPEPGVLIVHGTNGLGKSSLFDALEWTLTDAIDHFRVADGYKKVGTYLSRWREKPGPTSAALEFSDGSRIAREIASVKATTSSLTGSVADVTAFLRASDWSQPITALGRYLLLTHFLGQSIVSRLTHRPPSERFEILKEASQTAELEAFGIALHGKGSNLAARAFAKRISELEGRAKSLRELLTLEAQLWDGAQVAGAIDDGTAALFGQRIAAAAEASRVGAMQASVSEMSAAVATIAAHLPAESCECPVCATTFPEPQALAARVGAAADRLAPLLADLHDAARAAQAALDAVTARLDSLLTAQNQLRFQASEIAAAERQARETREAKDIAALASADIAEDVEEFSADYLKPLDALSNQINQAILCDPRVGVGLHVNKKKIEQSASLVGELPLSLGKVDPRLVHSEGQMAALAVSMLCAASLTYPPALRRRRSDIDRTSGRRWHAARRSDPAFCAPTGATARRS